MSHNYRGKEKADTIVSSARKHYEDICAENSDEPAAYDIHPKLIWGCTKTLGKGDDCCDFRMRIKK